MNETNVVALRPSRFEKAREEGAFQAASAAGVSLLTESSQAVQAASAHLKFAMASEKSDERAIALGRFKDEVKKAGDILAEVYLEL